MKFTCRLSTFTILFSSFFFLPKAAHTQEQKNSTAPAEQAGDKRFRPTEKIADPESETAQYQATLPPKPVPNEDEKVYNSIDSLPQAGYDIAQYLAQNVKYPKSELQKRIQGKVVLQFIINRQGEVKDVVVMKSLSPGCDTEALRVVKAMPVWKVPAMYNGKPVSIRYMLPIAFYVR
jgi:TonB family protein